MIGPHRGRILSQHYTGYNIRKKEAKIRFACNYNRVRIYSTALVVLYMHVMFKVNTQQERPEAEASTGVRHAGLTPTWEII
jgi:hypothetical protein